MHSPNWSILLNPSLTVVLECPGHRDRGTRWQTVHAGLNMVGLFGVRQCDSGSVVRDADFSMSSPRKW